MLSAAVAIFFVLAHAVLIPVGNWRYDEFDTFRHIRDGGLSFVWGRIVNWSPRPISELLLYGYGNFVQATGRPHIGLMLGVLWLALVIAVLAPTMHLFIKKKAAFWPIATIVLVMLAMFLLGHRIDEVFYWTQGAAAYITTLAAIAAIAVTHVSYERLSRTGHLLSNGLAVAAAMSSEMGAAFAVVYGTLMFAATHTRIASGLVLTRLRLSDLQFLTPIAAGLAIFYLSAGGRLGVSGEAVGDPSLLHRVLPSFEAALWHMPAELLSLGPAANGNTQYVWGTGVAVAFCAGVFGLLATSGAAVDRVTSLRILAVCVSALAATIVSLLAAYYQFGLVCCSRHETMRHCLSIIAAVSLMAFLYSLVAHHLTSWVGRGRIIVISCLLLTGSMAASSLVTLPYVLADLRNYQELRAASLANWVSGMSNSTHMDYLPSKSKIVCSPGSLVPGDYRIGENMPAQVAYIAKYFGKTEIIVKGNDEVCSPF